MEQEWPAFDSALRRRIGEQNMEIWIRQGLRIEHVHGGRVRLRATSRYYFDWIKDNLYRDIVDACSEAVGGQAQVDFSFDGAPSGEGPPPPPPPKRPQSNLDRQMSFESFVVGKCNEFAHAASIAVADGPGLTHNPLFIYGGTGLGKTHLAHAIGNRVLERDADAGVLYYTAQQFFDAMVRALQVRAIPDFRDRFKNEVDVLILDDVQFLAGRDRTEEELFYIFELMRSGGKQIIITADEPPRNIGKLEPRLRTRFEGGLMADVHPPDVETMMAILRQKAERTRLDIPSDVQYTIAQRVRNSVRELEGVLNRLAALHAFYGRPITMSFLQDRMVDLIPPPAPPPTADQIIARVADHFHLKPSDIKGDRRPANIARPRQIAMYLTRRITSLSFPEIGRAFDRDNATVQYACRKVEQETHTDPNLRAEIELLERLCREGG